VGGGDEEHELQIEREKIQTHTTHGFPVILAGPNHPPNRIPKGKIGKANDRVGGRKRSTLVESKGKTSN